MQSRILYLAGISSLKLYLVHLPLVSYVEKRLSITDAKDQS